MNKFLGLLLIFLACCLGCGDSHSVGVGGGSSQKSDEISRDVTQRSKRMTVDRRASTSIAVAARPLILEVFRAQMQGLNQKLIKEVAELLIWFSTPNYAEMWEAIKNERIFKELSRPEDLEPITPHILAAFVLTMPARPLVAWRQGFLGADFRVTRDGRDFCSTHVAIADTAANLFLDLARNCRGEILTDRETAIKRIWTLFLQHDPWQVFNCIDQKRTSLLHQDFLVELTGPAPAWQYPLDGVRAAGSPDGLMVFQGGVELLSDRKIRGQTIEFQLASSRGLQMDRGHTVEIAASDSASQESHGNIGVGKK